MLKLRFTNFFNCKIRNYRILFYIVLILTGCGINERDTFPLVQIESIYDFGRIEIQDTLKFQVSFQNIEKEAISIDYVGTPCGCLIAIPNYNLVTPNESSIIQFLYKPGALGYTEQNIFIYFKKYKKPIHVLIKGRVVSFGKEFDGT